jgi:2-dehydro-3-deoxyphosphogluconate aldolase/(4S)-4-hydroxy-2-oxoglutarate aldolase
VNLQNAGDFIRSGAAAVGVGGELVDKKAIGQKNFAVITETAKAFLKVIQEARRKG